MAQKRIGILTGGGDVPGLNWVIKAVVYRGGELGFEAVGIRKGWEGLTHLDPAGPREKYVLSLNRDNTRTIDRSGGRSLYSMINRSKVISILSSGISVESFAKINRIAESSELPIPAFS